MVSDPAQFAVHPAAGDVPAAPFDTPAIDCETAALLRAWLCPLLATADSWPGLVRTLDAKGYGLAIREGRLVLTRTDTGRRYCSARFLGTSLRELSARLGRPCVRARTDRAGAGEITLSTRWAH